MNQSLISRMYRLMVVAAVFAACFSVAGATGQAHAASSTCLKCRPQFAVTPGQTTMTGRAGQTVQIPIKLQNLNILVLKHLNLTVGDSMGWPLALSSTDVLLQASGATKVVLNVTIPPEMTPLGDETDHITLKVTDSRDTIYTNLYVTEQDMPPVGQ